MCFDNQVSQEQLYLFKLQDSINLVNVINQCDKTYYQCSDMNFYLINLKFLNVFHTQFQHFHTSFHHYLIQIVQSIITFDFYLCVYITLSFLSIFLNLSIFLDLSTFLAMRKLESC